MWSQGKGDNARKKKGCTHNIYTINSIVHACVVRVCFVVSLKVLDARELPFEACSFDLVVDKGTVDAMLCDATSGKDNAR